MMKSNRNSSNHPKPQFKKLIDERSSSYSPNSIGGRIDLESLRDKLFSQEQTNNKPTTQNDNAKDSKTSLQGKGKAK